MPACCSANPCQEYSEAYPFGVYPWCEAHGLAAAGACTAAGIADYLKDTLQFKIMGIFVNGAGAGAGSPAAVAAGQENMKRFSSCNGGATAAAAAGGGGAAAAAVNATGCSFYAQADNFAALAASAKAIGASLGTEARVHPSTILSSIAICDRCVVRCCLESS